MRTVYESERTYLLVQRLEVEGELNATPDEVSGIGMPLRPVTVKGVGVGVIADHVLAAELLSGLEETGVLQQ